MIKKVKTARSNLPKPFQTIRGLGEPVRTYGLGAFDKALVLMSTGGFMAAAVAGMYFGLVVFPERFPSVPMQYVTSIVGGGLFLLMGAMVWTWSILGRWDEMVAVFQDGMACTDGDKVRGFRWGEIVSLQAKGHTTGRARWFRLLKRPSYNIITDDGYLVTLDRSMPHVEDLYDQVRNRAKPHLLSRCQRFFESGQTVPFGPVSLSAEGGIHVGKRSIAWDDIGGVAVYGSAIHVKPLRRGIKGMLSRGLSIPAHRVHNLDVFMAITNDIVQALAADREEYEAYRAPVAQPSMPPSRPTPPLVPVEADLPAGPSRSQKLKEVGSALLTGGVASFEKAMPTMNRAASALDKAVPVLEKAVFTTAKKTQGLFKYLKENWPDIESSLRYQFGVNDSPKSTAPRKPNPLRQALRTPKPQGQKPVYRDRRGYNNDRGRWRTN
jgi:hypothetical protein